MASGDAKRKKEAKPVIIVESPAKIRTIRQFVGERYALAASMGHVRDLPKTTLGVDIEHDFRPKYVPIRERAGVLKRLREAVDGADTVYIATDPDREGEAIAWHLAQMLNLRRPLRIEFNEITRRAVTEALKRPREIDLRRVNAQQARRILDRLVGYTLSPLLQRKLRKRFLSAGRVQSVAVRLICDREREIQNFVPEEYWDITALVSPGDPEEAFEVKLIQREGRKLRIGSQEEAVPILGELWEAAWVVARVRETQQLRRPPAPFTTSTLQQEAANRLGMSARQTMRIAQTLYEGVELGDEGHVALITYMRTDSTRVAEEAQAAARAVIEGRFGPEYLPPAPRRYGVSRGAQEAHEAIRPTDPGRHPDQVEAFLEEGQARLYRLIWSRFMASQMADMRLLVRNVEVAAGRYLLRGVGVKVLFPGFAVLYPTRERERPIPDLAEGQWLDLLALAGEQKFTQPPPRYTEASLVRALEANGIGRPSTYAPIISTIQERGYVYLEDKKFRPTDLGFAVTDQLVAHFPEIMDVEFTAGMEEKLDQVEEGKQDWVQLLREFYGPFEQQLARADAEMGTVKVKALETEHTCERCGRPMLLRVGRRGPFLACSGYPECDYTRPAPGGGEGRARPARTPPAPTEERCEKCGAQMVIRTGRRGRFLSCSAYPKCRYTRPLPEEEARLAELAAGEKCEQCGAPMAVRQSRWGPFLGCTRYPECRGTKRLPSGGPGSAAEEEKGEEGVPEGDDDSG